MEIDIIWQPVEEYLERRTQPVIAVVRAKEHTYWTASSLLGDPIDWSPDRTSEHVLVPMHAYKTRSLDASALFGLGIELGLRAVASFGRREIRRMVLILGDACHEDADSIHGYAGLVLVTGVRE